MNLHMQLKEESAKEKGEVLNVSNKAAQETTHYRQTQTRKVNTLGDSTRVRKGHVGCSMCSDTLAPAVTTAPAAGTRPNHSINYVIR